MQKSRIFPVSSFLFFFVFFFFPSFETDSIPSHPCERFTRRRSCRIPYMELPLFRSTRKDYQCPYMSVSPDNIHSPTPLACIRQRISSFFHFALPPPRERLDSALDARLENEPILSYLFINNFFLFQIQNLIAQINWVKRSLLLTDSFDSNSLRYESLNLRSPLFIHIS